MVLWWPAVNSAVKMTDAVRHACRAVAERFRGIDPLGRTCELIEEMRRKVG